MEIAIGLSAVLVAVALFCLVRYRAPRRQSDPALARDSDARWADLERQRDLARPPGSNGGTYGGGLNGY
jgi:hypothetical protein